MKSLLFLLFPVFFLACNSSGSEDSPIDTPAEQETGVMAESEATFVHTVFFWMKEDFTAEEALFFEEWLEKLGKVPSIHAYRWGKPAGTPREVVDNTYTYAWIVDFTSIEKQDEYQEDPLHLQFIEEAGHLWTKVQVYDTVLE